MESSLALVPLPSTESVLEPSPRNKFKRVAELAHATDADAQDYILSVSVGVCGPYTPPALLRTMSDPVAIMQHVWREVLPAVHTLLQGKEPCKFGITIEDAAFTAPWTKNGANCAFKTRQKYLSSCLFSWCDVESMDGRSSTWRNVKLNHEHFWLLPNLEADHFMATTKDGLTYAKHYPEAKTLIPHGSFEYLSGLGLGLKHAIDKQCNEAWTDCLRQMICTVHLETTNLPGCAIAIRQAADLGVREATSKPPPTQMAEYMVETIVAGVDGGLSASNPKCADWFKNGIGLQRIGTTRAQFFSTEICTNDGTSHQRFEQSFAF